MKKMVQKKNKTLQKFKLGHNKTILGILYTKKIYSQAHHSPPRPSLERAAATSGFCSRNFSSPSGVCLFF